MTTLKQEIKKVKMNQEKIFKIDFETEYITARRTKKDGLQIIISDTYNDYNITYKEVKNNFKDFTLYSVYNLD